MSSSLKPCPEGRLAHLDLSDRVNTLYICLVEDRGVEKDALRRSIAEEVAQRRLGIDAIGLSPDGVVELLSDFLIKLREAVVKSIREVHGERGPVDISIPRVSDEKINPGEFAGNFVILNNDSCRVVLHVEPKIGWDGYIKMLQETKQSIDILASKTGVLEPLIGNLYYPSLSSPISYSILLLRLTEMILSSTPPKKTMSIEVVSQGVVGRPIIHKTLKYVLRGYPLGVYERVKIVLHDYPFMLLAKFHYDLSVRLAEILGILREAIGNEGYYWLLADRIATLQNLHMHYLTTPPLHSIFNVLLRERVSEQELVEEARRAARTNPYFGLLADLYEMYISNIGLIHEYVERGEIIPSASCKIYELWVLTRIIDFLEKRCGKAPIVERYRDLYTMFRIGQISLRYNMPQYGFFLRRLRKYGVVAGRGARLRPDFVLERGKEVVVYDAKYRMRIALRDLVTLLAYIAEYAYPITKGGEKILLGALYKLARSPRQDEVSYRAVKNRALPMKVAIHIYTLDPRMPKGRIEETIEHSLQPLLNNVKNSSS